MAGWKDELKEIKSAIQKKNDEIPPPADSVECSNVPDEVEWKSGVKPLKKRFVPDARSHAALRQKTRRVAPENKTRPSSKKSHTVKRLGKKFNDHLPSDATINSVYGRSKTKQQPGRPRQESSTVTIPPIDDFPDVSLASKAAFKMPDKWVDEGLALNCQGGGQGRVLRIRMGIDFGTSFTKVALKLADKVYFVDWAGICCGDPTCLLPGEISYMKSGSILVGASSEAVKVGSGLKNPFLSTGSADHSRYVPSMVFLAWVMRYSRAWLYRHHPDLLRSRRLVWEVNIGSPTAPWFLDAVVQQYEKVAKTAWKLSQIPDEMTEKSALELLGTEIKIDDVGLDEEVGVIPEFVAQVAGYVKSPQRKDGLYLLADIGAGTVDIAAFNIYRKSRDDIDRFPIFEGAVSLLGTHVLMATRLIQHGHPVDAWDDSHGIPSPSRLANDMNIEKSKIQEVDDHFSCMVSSEISKILTRTKKYRYPGAREWKEGMRVFLAGGGSNCEAYKLGVRKAFEGLHIQPNITPFPTFPGVVMNDNNDDFHRLSVAYGLTFDSTALGEVIRPQDIEDIPLRSQVRERPDRDELYAK